MPVSDSHHRLIIALRPLWLATATLPLWVWPAWQDGAFTPPKLWGLSAWAVLGLGVSARGAARSRALWILAIAVSLEAWAALSLGRLRVELPWLVGWLSFASMAPAAAGGTIAARDLARLERVLQITALGVLGIALAQRSGFDPFTPIDGLTGAKWAVYSTLGNPNRVAYFLGAIAAAAAMACRAGDAPQSGSRKSWKNLYFGAGESVRQRWIFWAMTLGVLVTLSRGATLALVLTLVAFRKFRFAGILAGGALAVALLAPESVSKWWWNERSITGRFELWKEAWDLIRAQPWMGLGLGGYGDAPSTRADQVHGEWLGAWVELGLVRGTLWMGALVALGVRAWRKRAQDAAPAAVLLFLGIGSIWDFPLREPSSLLVGAWAVLRLGARQGASVRAFAVDDPDYGKALGIRRAVFVAEQGVPEAIEIDEHDQESTHFLLRTEEGTPVAAGRLRRKGTYAKFERIATLREYRGKGFGRVLMDAMQTEAVHRFPELLPAMHAQESAIPFYEKLGWIAQGPVFFEADIPHRLLTRPHT